MSYPSFQKQVEPWDEHVYVCQYKECTRFFVPWLTEAYPFDEQARWLVAPLRADNRALVVRCPQHITESALRKSIGYNKENRQWAEISAEEDLPTHEAWSPVTPYPLDPRLLFGDDGKFVGELSPKTANRLRVAKDQID